MTAAFAKALGIDVQYHRLIATSGWNREGHAYLRSDHVNLVLGQPVVDLRTGQERSWRIEFGSPRTALASRTRPIPETTIVAMYLNNRAVEALVLDQVNDAYWWAREAISEDESLLAAYNTLGVIYMRRGALAQAERAFRYVLGREPRNVSALANLVEVLRRSGRPDEADQVDATLKETEGEPPFSFFDRGMAAMERGEFESARTFFAKEVERDAYHHEFHFWLAIANYRLGDRKRADRHLRLAIDYSTTLAQRDFYAAILRDGFARTSSAAKDPGSIMQRHRLQRIPYRESE